MILIMVLLLLNNVKCLFCLITVSVLFCDRSAGITTGMEFYLHTSLFLTSAKWVELILAG